MMGETTSEREETPYAILKEQLHTRYLFEWMFRLIVVLYLPILGWMLITILDNADRITRLEATTLRTADAVEIAANQARLTTLLSVIEVELSNMDEKVAEYHSEIRRD